MRFTEQREQWDDDMSQFSDDHDADLDLMNDHLLEGEFDDTEDGEFEDFEDDGQPTEYEEWQDLYGGDDAFQYDDVGDQDWG